MSDTVIRVEDLGKKYILGHQKQERYTALRDVIANKSKSVGHKLLKDLGKKISDPTIDEFWALKDVSFEIKGRSRWHYRSQWCRKINVVEDFKSDYGTNERKYPD